MQAASQQRPAAPEPLAASLPLMTAQPLLMLPEQQQPADMQGAPVRVLGAVKAQGGSGVTCKTHTCLSPPLEDKSAFRMEMCFRSDCNKKQKEKKQLLPPCSLIESAW